MSFFPYRHTRQISVFFFACPAGLQHGQPAEQPAQPEHPPEHCPLRSFLSSPLSTKNTMTARTPTIIISAIEPPFLPNPDYYTYYM